jgi:phospholipase C
VSRLARLVGVAVLLSLGIWRVPQARADASPAEQTTTTTPIKHFVTIMQENHTFDNYFGTYPGAEGLPREVCIPVKPFDPSNTECIEPFHIRGGIEDLDHSTATHLLQFNDARLDGFVYALEQLNQTGEQAMGYYDGRDIGYYWNLADRYVLFDRFFSSAIGGSVWNHMFWVAGAPGSQENSTPYYGFRGVPTIFDRLERAGISWKFYVQNYDPRVTFRVARKGEDDRPQVVWCPLLAIPRFVDDPKLNKHIVHLDQYYKDLRNGTLPAVSYIVPSGASEHPPGSIQAGVRFVAGLIHALMQSESWESSAFHVTYDDWGGWYDHVPPPRVDRYGYGFRVPAFMVSPYAREGYVDSTTMDFASIPAFIEENWRLDPLAPRDAKANTFMRSFDFGRGPREAAFIPFERGGTGVEEARTPVVFIVYTAALVFAVAVLVLAAAPRWRWARRRPGGRAE